MKHMRDEQGAVAVLLAILLTMALAFATAAGLSSLTRAGTRGELQRAADAGSLAGARLIPVGDVNAALAYIRSPQSVLWPRGENPLEVACGQAVRTATEDDAISENYAEPLGKSHCKASYLHDLQAVDRLEQCARSLLAAPPNVPGTVLDPLLASLPPPTELLHARLANLAPALLRPGVKVELSRAVAGEPVEGVLPDDENVDRERVVSIARRRFKNLIVIPIADVLPALLDEPINLNTHLADTHDEVFGIIETIDAQFEQSLDNLSSTLGWNLNCRTVFDALKDDFNDVYNPASADPPSHEQVIADLQATGEETMALIVGWSNGAALTYPNDPTATLNIPFFDFVPVCLQGDVAIPGDAACASEARGAFRASLVNGEHEDGSP